MVRLPKTALPDNVKIKSREDWSHGSAVRALLETDCYAKCYICEDKPKNPDELTVDHVIPQNSRPDLIHEWSNLLLACSFCNNNAKGHKYDNIINPVLEDPEEYISYIRESNSPFTAYSAFKRQIVRDDRELTALVA
jgi:5-methylcytosine-specific restriction endonuclease McrA